MIKGIQITNLKKISDERGAIFHMLKKVTHILLNLEKSIFQLLILE